MNLKPLCAVLYMSFGLHGDSLDLGPQRNWFLVSALRCLFLLGLFGCSAAVSASNTDHIVERAWLSDTTSNLTWEAVRELPMQKFAGVFSGGYGTAPLWFRLRIDPVVSHASPTDTLYLRVRPAYLDELAVYDPLQLNGSPLLMGDRFSFTPTAGPGSQHVLALPAGAEPRDVWIRLQTTSTRLAAFDVFTERDLQASTAYGMHLGALYLSAIGLLAVWGAVHCLWRPEPVMITFTLYQCIQWLFSFSLLGYARLYWLDWLGVAAVNKATSVLGVMVVAAAMLFYHHLLLEVTHSRWVRRIGFGLQLFWPVLLGLIAAGHESQALQINMGLVLFGPLLYFLMGLLAKPAPVVEGRSFDQKSRLLILGYFAVCSLLLVFTSLPSLGWLRGAQTNLYGVLVYALVTGMLMLVVLQYRTHSHMKWQEHLAAEMQIVENRAQNEREMRLEREKLLAMLGHELKTPVAAMRMLVGYPALPEVLKKPMETAVLEMKQVVERTLEAGLVEDLSMAVGSENCDLAELVQQQIALLEKPSRVQLDLPSGMECRLNSDPQLLVIVLRNLLDNAIKYSPVDSSVWLSLCPNGTGWRVTVENLSGPAGRPDPTKVFSKYYRSPKARYRSGSGLGLYMVHSLTGALGGTIVYTAEAENVRFTLDVGDVIPGAQS